MSGVLYFPWISPQISPQMGADPKHCGHCSLDNANFALYTLPDLKEGRPPKYMCIG